MKIAVGILLALIVSDIKLSGGGQNQDDVVDQNSLIPEGRIINGGTAQEGQFPYQALLTIRYGLLGLLTNVCGGSIIGDGWILTAGHCYQQPSLGSQVSYEVTVGSLSASGTGGEKDTVLPPNAFLHPNYKFENNIPINDVAVVKTRVFQYSSNIQPIPLVGSGLTLEGSQFTVSGFGYTSNSGPVSNVLKYARIIGLEPESCEFGTPNEAWFCAGADASASNGGTVCSGDSGGPVTIIKNNVVMQAGVVSFGSTDCAANPAAYADLTNEIILTWILNAVAV
uniref:Uncharacterized protein n=1 Tax=Phlebotomus papatasi TaxID=29031 RepID=A0A1B0DHD7_PHLPP